MKPKRLLLFILIGTVLYWASFSFAQPNEPQPAPRYGATLAELDTGEVVLFGGQGSSGELLDDTWTWNGSRWVKETPPLSPPARVRAGMAFDAVSGRVVLFGGQGSLGLLNDTWTWDGTTWTLASTGFPTPRFGMAIGEDAALQRVVMQGGIDAISGTGETNLWNGTAWEPAVVLQSPGTFEGADIAARPGGVSSSVLFGGCGHDGPIDETWSWSGTWMILLIGERPLARCEHSLALDAARERTVLFGGTDDTQVFGDTWLFTGTGWIKVSTKPQPPARFGAGMAYHAASQRVVLFGGMTSTGGVLGDTWLWNGTVWKRAKLK